MIARSSQPVSLRNIFHIFDRVASIRPLLDRYFRPDRYSFQRILKALGAIDLAACSEVLLQDRFERFRHFCPDCRGETLHEGFDELGFGWYAQIARCRQCGRQGMRVWALG